MYANAHVISDSAGLTGVGWCQMNLGIVPLYHQLLDVRRENSAAFDDDESFQEQTTAHLQEVWRAFGNARILFLIWHLDSYLFIYRTPQPLMIIVTVGLLVPKEW